MQQGKSSLLAIFITIIITAVVVGGGVYLWQKNQIVPLNPKTAVKENLPEPLSYSTTGVSVSVSKNTAPFDYTAEQLKSMADECGSKYNADYFNQLVTKFSGASKIIYNFKYNGTSQNSDTFVVTLLPNRAGYTSLEQFKKDFDICAAGEGVYPKMFNSKWLLFINSCGSGSDDASGRPIGCQKVQDVVEPTLKLN